MTGKTLDEIYALVLPSAEDTEADKPFLKNNVSPSVSTDDTLMVLLNAAAGAATILSFLGGPAGIVVAAGITFAHSLLPLASTQKSSMSQLFEGVEKIRVAGMLEEQLNKVKAFGSWVNDYQEIVDSEDLNLAEEKKGALDRLNSETATGDTLYEKVLNLEDHMAFDTPRIRVAVYLSLTYLFIAYNLKCRIHATLATAYKKTGNNTEYESHLASYRATIKILAGQIKLRSDRVKKSIATQKKWRKDQVRWVSAKSGFDAANPFQGIPSFDCEDQYNGTNPWYLGSNEVWKKTTEEGGWSLDNLAKGMKKEMQKYELGLEAHVERTFANDLKIVGKWDAIQADTERLLTPVTPTKAPDVTRYTPVDEPHPLLEGAKCVAYCYTVGTQHYGTSAPSPWTGWLPLENKEGAIQYPVLTIGDSGYVLETTRTVYHRVLKDGDAVVEPSQNVVLENCKADTFTKKGGMEWVDSEQALPQGRS